jgi:hypothetical protein
VPRAQVAALAVVIATAGVASAKKPVPIVRRAPQRLTGSTTGPPLRFVVKHKGVPTANCIFAPRELPEQAAPTTPVSSEFSRGQPIWGRCYFPTPVAALHPGELVDVISVDGKRVWEQGYSAPPAPGSLSHLVPYADILRGILDGLAPGSHLVQIEGVTKRHGGRPQRLYVGTFRFLR